MAVPVDTDDVRQVLCPVLVGRDEEARRLHAALVAAQEARGGTLLLAGEAGIGKSRLDHETARAARARGFVVLPGRTPRHRGTAGGQLPAL